MSDASKPTGTAWSEISDRVFYTQILVSESAHCCKQALRAHAGEKYTYRSQMNMKNHPVLSDGVHIWLTHNVEGAQRPSGQYSVVLLQRHKIG